MTGRNSLLKVSVLLVASMALVGSSTISANENSACDTAGDQSSTLSLSFADAVTLLKDRNQRLQAAAESERRSSELRAAARGLRLPHLQATARATRIDEPIAIDLEPIRSAMLGLHPTVPEQMVPPFVAEIQDDRFFKAQMKLSWPLYTGGKITAANRAAEAQVKDVRQQSRDTEQQLLTELVHRYYGLRLAEQVCDTRRQVLEGMEQHLFQARRLEEEGFVARAERLHAEVAHAEAKRELQAAEQDLALAAAALRSLLVSERELHPTTNLFVVHALPPLEDLQRTALEDNPKLGRLSAQRALAQQGVAAERAAYLPEVALFAVRELATSDLTVLEPDWAVGVGLSLKVFDGGARSHQLSAARAAERGLAHLAEDARQRIALLTEKHYRKMLKAVEQFDSLTPTLVLAEENLRVRTRAFEEGFATSLDVVDARTTLASAQLARLAASYDFVTELAELLAATGQSESFENYRHLAAVEVNS